MAPYFDRNAPQYKCCCGAVHAKTGAAIFGCLACLGVFIAVIQAIIQAANVNGHMKTPVAGIAINGVFLVFYVIVVILLMLGLMKERHRLIIPYIVVQFISLVFTVIAVIMFALVAFGVSMQWVLDQNGITRPDNISLAAMGGIMAVMYAIIILIEIWALSVMITAYKYIRDLNRFHSNPPQPNVLASYSNPAGVGMYPQAQQAPAYH